MKSGQYVVLSESTTVPTRSGDYHYMGIIEIVIGMKIESKGTLSLIQLLV